MDIYHFFSGGLANENEKYFWYHHSKADTIEAYEPWMLDQSTAFWAGLAYVAADITVQLPRNDIERSDN